MTIAFRRSDFQSSLGHGNLLMGEGGTQVKSLLKYFPYPKIPIMVPLM